MAKERFFRSVRVEANEKLEVFVEKGDLFKITQISLDETVSDTVVLLRADVNETESILGRLSPSRPDKQVELVFHCDFSLSHSRNSGSVFFTGHTIRQKTTVEKVEGNVKDKKAEVIAKKKQKRFENRKRKRKKENKKLKEN